MHLVLLLVALLAAGCSVAESDDPRPEGHGNDLETLRALTDLDPAEGVVRVALTAREREVEILSGTTTRVWMYEDASLDESPARLTFPLIVARPGDVLVVDFSNELSLAATTVHWHGLRLPSGMDGAANHGDEVFPGESFQYRFVVGDPGTFWFHPHVRSDEQIERGLVGALVVRADGSMPAHTERVLLLDDVDLDAAGTMRIEADDEDVAMGRHGPLILVNGSPEPRLPAVAGDVERWRLIGAANGRTFDVCADGLTFEIVETDGGALQRPIFASCLRIVPGERLTVDVALPDDPGAVIEVVTRPVDVGHGPMDEGDRLLWSITLEEGAPGTPRPILPVAFDPIAAPGAEVAREMVLSQVDDPVLGRVFFINGEAWPFNEHLTGSAGDVEVWRIENEASGAHPFHLHGMFFQVLDETGVPRTDLGWKDTIDVPARSAVTLAVRLAEGRWMFHCQIPEHAERGMMGEIHVAR